MSISVTNFVNISQAALKFLVQEAIDDEPIREFKTNGGVLSNNDYAWISNGPRIQIIHTKTGNKVGAWTFGWILKDSNTEVICVGEIQRPNGRLPLLAIGIDCDFSGGMICIFDFMASKIIRAIQIKDKISTLHVIDAGYDVFTLPGPLRNFDGIIAIGTAGGDVHLLDICRQICDEALTVGGLNEIRDELTPSQLFNITSRDLGKIEHHKEFAIRNSHHLAIHLNVVHDKSTKHFILKGPKGEDRIHVNKDEVAVSALYYCPQLGSLLVGYNFGALQLFNLMNLQLVYTSPVCDEHIPISHFSVQEPADDPKAVCYIWAVYSTDEEYTTCLPLAVMYAFSYQSKEYHEGYGCLYQDFSSASVHYQMELGVPFDHNRLSKQRGGNCLKIQSISHGLSNREGLHHEANEDNLTLCVFVWSVCFSNKQTETFLAVFDLNQWYKEQMPNIPKAEYFSTYMLQLSPTDLITSATSKSAPILNISVNENSVQQFVGAQRLEEHFYPNSLTFGMTCLRQSDVIFLRNYGVQKALLAQIESSGPLCLVEPAQIYQEVVGLGLVPLFVDLPVNAPITTNQQREIILGTALENHLIGWLCKCASEWANGSFLSAGCSIELLISWAFQRAVTLKTNCDKFCTPLFDYSGMRLDNNTNILLNRCRRQLKNLCSLYGFVMKKLSTFISNIALVQEQFNSLETVTVYFEVLQWLLNVGLLPECPISAYPRLDDLDRISAPYPAEMLTDFYNHKRALLKILNQENYSSSKSVLFIDALIERECGGKYLQEEWRNDGGNGLYPPPSLQALLRTYLIDDVNLFYKHSVIIYVFLDLAMTLDQDKYKLVITHLIKFPAVFKVSPSVIKITQGFWQLDHSDFNTAMRLLLDPLIASEDLTQWHHAIVLRALMLQKQHNFALYYVQVRKPVLKDEDDILTAISLYVANHMIDEAFYFVSHSGVQKEEKFLLHLFNECKKNEQLRSLIYRSLTSPHENTFLNYLANSNESVAEDLYVYHNILKSHFGEAFESHARSIPNVIETQGLVGQENAIPRDKLVACLRKLLAGVNFRSSVPQKENYNAYHLVSRPAAKSVFVHKVIENVQYKSTMIGADLGKAQEKFKMGTEGTPFFSNLTNSKRSSPIIVTPRLIDMNTEPSDTSPPPSKRLRVSPKFNSSLSVSIPSKLDTPLVKRKIPRVRKSEEEVKATTPHSILKVKSFVNHTAQADGEFEDDFKEFEKLEYTPVNSRSKRSGLGLTPRKSLTKSLPVVRFEGLKSFSSSSLNNTRSSSSMRSAEKLSISPVVKSDSIDIQRSHSSKDTSADDVFYSPNSSLEKEEQTEPEATVPTKETSTLVEVMQLPSELVVSAEVTLNSNANNQEEEKDKVPESKVNSNLLFSPKGRRSYRRSLQSAVPVRSSPRLSRNAKLANESASSTETQNEEPESTKVTFTASAKDPTESFTALAKDSTEDKTKSVDALSSTSPRSKLRPRRSLCRQVLETNALSRVLESPKIQKSKSVEITKITNVQETTEKIVLEHNLTTSSIESEPESSDGSFIYQAFTEAPKLSDSMMEYLKRQDKILCANTTMDGLSSKDTPVCSTSKTITTTGASPSERGLVKANSLDSSGVDVTLAPNEEDKVVPLENANSTVGSTAYSIFESSAEFSFSYDPTVPELSESMQRCINNRDIEKSSVDTSQNEDVEVMEVDDDEVAIEEDKVEANRDVGNEPIYTTLITSTPTENEKQETNTELVYEKEGKGEENVESFHSAGNRPVDPEMNVFEISDDLSFNDGILIEREVTLEENDLCYGQQNTLENVLEENISTAASTPLDVLEKNVFNESYESEVEEDEIQEEPHLDSEPHNGPDNKELEDEVIEIGSSSEEEHHSNEEESSRSESYSSTNDDDNDFMEDQNLYERNIYDSEEDHSSKSSYERHYSEISENSDEVQSEMSNEGCGLFQGDIIFLDETHHVENKNTEKDDERTLESEKIDNSHNHKTSNDDMGESKQFSKKNVERTEIEKSEEEIQGIQETDENVEVAESKSETMVEQVLKKVDFEKISPEKQVPAEDGRKEPPSVSQAEILEENREQLGHLEDSDEEMDELNYPILEDCNEKNAAVEKEANKKLQQDVASNENSTKVEQNVENRVEMAVPAQQSAPVTTSDQLADDHMKDSFPIDIDTLPVTVVLKNFESSQGDVIVQASSSKNNSLDMKDSMETSEEIGLDDKSALCDRNRRKLTPIPERSTSSEILTSPATDVDEKINKSENAGRDLLENLKSPNVDERLESVERDALENLKFFPLDTAVVEKLVEKTEDIERDALENLPQTTDLEDKPRRKRSASVSSSTSSKSTRKAKRKDDSETIKTTKRTTDNFKKQEPDDIDVSNEIAAGKQESDDVGVSTEAPAGRRLTRRATDDFEKKEANDSHVNDEVPVGRRLTRRAAGNSEKKEPDDIHVSEKPSGKRLTRKTTDSFEKKQVVDVTVSNEVPVGRRLTRRATDTSDKSEVDVIHISTEVLPGKRQAKKTNSSSKSESSTENQKLDADYSMPTSNPVRTLRSRRISTEEVATPTVQLRKRSASVDEVQSETQQTKKTIELDSKSRTRRATSVVRLPDIKEEETKTENKTHNVLEDYSSNRRITRKQVTLLRKIEGDKLSLQSVDPIVLLDKVSFDGKPDSEEQRVYDTSPSTTNSTSSSPVKTRRTRSASQTSELSRRSKSKTPVRNVKTSKEKSQNETRGSKTNKSKKNLEEISGDVTEEIIATEPRKTRARTKSTSSVNSEDSNMSDGGQLGNRKRRTLLTQNCALPEIHEEPTEEEKSAVPKKRTRKNSSQI